jgi:RNA polymerase sigma-70 factor (ECF subfamily)
METQLLAQQIANGNGQAFEQLFKLYYARLTGYAISILSDKEIAEEIVQDVFTNIWTNRNNLNPEISLKAYLFKAVNNRCMNHFRHEKVKSDYQKNFMDVYPNQQTTAESRLAVNELKNKIAEGLNLLPLACREVFRLSRLEELSYKEIAEVLNISVKTVENHMGKALKQMRKHLSDFLSWALVIQLTSKYFLNIIGVEFI